MMMEMNLGILSSVEQSREIVKAKESPALEQPGVAEALFC